MSLYIISNRKVEKVDGHDHFSSDNDSGVRIFRVAECKMPTDSESRRVTYDILQDLELTDYEDIIINIKTWVENNMRDDELSQEERETLGGTGYMFYDLYTQMLKSRDQPSEVLSFIHGFATSFEDSLAHIYTLKQLYIDDPDSPVEHVMAGIKRLNIVKEKIRLRMQGIRDQIMLIACGLHNLRIA